MLVGKRVTRVTGPSYFSVKYDNGTKVRAKLENYTIPKMADTRKLKDPKKLTPGVRTHGLWYLRADDGKKWYYEGYVTILVDKKKVGEKQTSGTQGGNTQQNKKIGRVEYAKRKEELNALGKYFENEKKYVLGHKKLDGIEYELRETYSYFYGISKAGMEEELSTVDGMVEWVYHEIDKAVLKINIEK